MKRFDSPLKRLQEIRHQSQQLAKVTVALRQAERDAISSQAEAIAESVASLCDESAAAFALGTDATVIQSVQAAIEQLHGTLSQTIQKHELATQQLNESLALWQQAKQQAKLVEDLVGRQRESHQLGQRRQEEHESHEQVVQRAHLSQFEAARREATKS